MKALALALFVVGGLLAASALVTIYVLWYLSPMPNAEYERWATLASINVFVAIPCIGVASILQTWRDP